MLEKTVGKLLRKSQTEEVEAFYLATCSGLVHNTNHRAWNRFPRVCQADLVYSSLKSSSTIPVLKLSISGMAPSFFSRNSLYSFMSFRVTIANIS